MSVSDGTGPRPGTEDFSTGPNVHPNLLGEVTLSGNLVLDVTYREVLRLDPDGSNRDVTLPAEADAKGRKFEIINTADGAEDLVVKDDAGTTVVTVSQNEKCTVWTDGTSWYHTGIITIALS